MDALRTLFLIAALGTARCLAHSCGSEVLDQVPLIVGANFLASNIHKLEKDQINFFNFNSDLTMIPKWKRSSCNTDLPRLLAGKVGAQFWTVFVKHRKDTSRPVKETLDQIDFMKRLIAKYPDHLRFVDSAEGIMGAFSDGKIGSLLAVDGGHSIDSSLGVLRHYYDLGVRCMALVRTYNTPWSFSAHESNTKKRGLKTFGRDVVREMNRLGMLIDLTHSSYQMIVDVIGISKAPVIFSHASKTPLCNKEYNKLLRMLRERRGIMMVSFSSSAVKCNKKKPTMEHAVALINLVRKVAGVDHVGIGASYDSDGGKPSGLEDVSRFPALFDRLGNRRLGEPDWSDEDLRKLAGENLLRVFREVEKVRDDMANQDAIEQHLRSKTRTA